MHQGFLPRSFIPLTTDMFILTSHCRKLIGETKKDEKPQKEREKNNAKKTLRSNACIKSLRHPIESHDIVVAEDCLPQDALF